QGTAADRGPVRVGGRRGGGGIAGRGRGADLGRRARDRRRWVAGEDRGAGGERGGVSGGVPAVLLADGRAGRGSDRAVRAAGERGADLSRPGSRVAPGGGGTSGAGRSGAVRRDPALRCEH